MKKEKVKHVDPLEEARMQVAAATGLISRVHSHFGLKDARTMMDKIQVIGDYLQECDAEKRKCPF